MRIMKPPTQADSIFQKFGGVPKLHAALERLADVTGDDSVRRNLSTLYRWNLPRAVAGTGGLIPTTAWPDILRAAKLHGIHIAPEDIVAGLGVVA